MKRFPSNRRRGIALITVVSLLVLFMLLGVTYVIIARQSQDASLAQERRYFHKEDPQLQLESVLYQLLTDTSLNSSIKGHSLLRDLHGNEGVIGRVAVDLSTYPNSALFPGTAGDRNPIAVAGGEFIEFHFRADRLRDTTTTPFTHPQFRATPPFGNQFIQEDHAYNGSVLTFLDGPWTGYSAHISAYRFHRGPDGGWGELNAMSGDVDDDGDGNMGEADEAGWPGTDDIIRIRIPRPKPDFDNAVTALSALIGNRFLINGHPFNGTGAGYALGTGNLDLAVWQQGPDNEWGFAGTDDDGDGTVDEMDEQGWAGSDDIRIPYVALLPHFDRYDSVIFDPSDSSIRPAAFGGMDESYDAVDYQNMALAMVPADVSVGIIPTFHRPALVNFWHSNGADGTSSTPSLAIAGNNEKYRDFRAKYIFRPMPWDHPNFTGSNPTFAGLDGTDADPFIWGVGPDGDPGRTGIDDDLDGTTDNDSERGAPGSDDVLDNDAALIAALSSLNSRWDVDNDGDGVPESIWIDIGLPVRTAPNGKQYKPLVAILVKDLDGRLNINAHDNLAQLNPRFQDASGNLAQVPFSGQMAFAGAAPTNSSTFPLAPFRGLGYGPSEISLRHLLNNEVDHQRLVGGRYGLDASVPTSLHYSNTAQPGDRTLDEPLSKMQSIGLPRAPNNFNNVYTGYGSRPDIIGVSSWALEYFGQPTNRYAGQDYTLNQVFNDPYELNLNDGGDGRDTPYTVAELERLLRSNDGDATVLPNRILTMANSIAGSWPNKEQVTTDSYSIPTVHAWMLQDPVFASFVGTGSGLNNVSSTPNNRRDDVIRVPTLTELYRRVLRLGMGGATPQQIENELYEIAPWEFMQAKPFDINRVWGNGVDDDQDGIVDEPYERDQRDFQGSATIASERWEPNGVDDDGMNGIDDPGEFAAGAEERILQNTGGYFDNAIMDHTNAGPLTRSRAAANPSTYPYVLRYGAMAPYRYYPRIGREVFARHLYCMMMMIKGFQGPGGVGNANHKFIDFDGDPTNDSIQETARGLAQWAINVVDFRDPDVIMTAFEYDINPFSNGWNVDGNPNTDEGSTRGVVFGCERPELLITESMAFHDRRTEDRDDDPTGHDTDETDPMDRDDDWDQRFLPESGAFFELFNPWVGSEDTVSASYKRPTELYSSHVDNGGTNEIRLSSGVKLDRRSRIGGSPVWRVLVLRDTAIGTDGDVLGNEFSTTEVERRVYFTDVSSFNDQLGNANSRYYTSVNHLPPVRPGRYAVVGSAGRLIGGTDYVTTIGRRADVVLDDVIPGGGGPMNRNNTRRLIFTPDLTLNNAPSIANFNSAEANANTHQFRVSSNLRGGSAADPAVQMTRNNMPHNPTDAATPGHIQPVVGIPIDRVASVATPPLPPEDRSYFSISEPVGGYGVTRIPPTIEDEDAILNPPRDEPLDRNRDVWFNGTSNNPYREFVLQRLANPTLDWNPMPGQAGHNADLPVNPYLTVDRSGVHLTSFNGLVDYVNYDGSATKTSRGEATVPDMNLNFRASQRGDTRLDLAQEYTAGIYPGAAHRVLWRQDGGNYQSAPTAQRNHPEAYPAAGRPVHRFAHEMIQTLGYLNQGYHPFFTNGTAPIPEYRGAPTYATMTEQPSGDTVPNAPPFPWLAWHNRPFANPMEVMQVPWTSSAQLPVTFDVLRGADGNEAYQVGQSARRTQRRFPHLMPFFQSADPSATEMAPHLYRLFDLIETPSPYVGTKTWLNPNLTSYNSNGADLLRPPFNKISRFRDPGRVNINTIFSSGVWNGIAKSFPYHNVPVGNPNALQRLVVSRQGYANPLTLNNSYPTFFANPVRSASSSHLAPNVAGLRKTDVASAGSIDNRPIQATLARNALTSQQPAFHYRHTTGHEYHNADRNPAFRYHGLQRLSNLTTNKSNVYAIWMTMGYFEVEPSPYGATPTHPDGYLLGQELGIDTGEAERHRSFYIIDRSIPVAFEPGENHNVDRAVVLRRYIE